MKIVKLVEMSCTETSVEITDEMYEELLKNPNLIYSLTRSATEDNDYSLYNKTIIEVEDEDYNTVNTINL